MIATLLLTTCCSGNKLRAIGMRGSRCVQWTRVATVLRSSSRLGGSLVLPAVGMCCRTVFGRVSRMEIAWSTMHFPIAVLGLWLFSILSVAGTLPIQLFVDASSWWHGLRSRGGVKRWFAKPSPTG